jgi:hypothetical protein
MLNLSSPYHNPQIEAGYYYVKVIDVCTQDAPGCKRPRLLVRVQIHPEHDLGEDVTLAAVIHPSENSQHLYTNFCQTFLTTTEQDVQHALNRWGSVYIYPAQYGNTHYSAIQWVYQPHRVKLAIAEIYRREREAALERQHEQDLATF